MSLICFYSIATHLGGAERCLLDLVVRLRASSAGRYRPWVLLPKNDGPLVDELKRSHIDFSVLVLPKSVLALSRQSSVVSGSTAALALAGYCRGLRAAIDERQPALIHANGLKGHVLGTVATLSQRVPLLWHLHDILRPGPTVWLLRRLASSRRVRLVANSQATATAFSPKRKDLAVIHNGIDPSRFAGEKNDLFRRVFKVSSAVPIVGIVGALARWKGQLEFLEMAARLIAGGIDARFVVVGDEIYDTASDPGYGQELRQRVQQLGLQDHVHFTGFLPDPAPAYRGLDILVHASTRPEPFGLVIIEAMAAGVPLAATSAGGVTEILEHESTGLLYPPGDIAQMLAMTQRLIRDNALRQRMIGNMRAAVLGRFTIDRHVGEMIRLYDSILPG